MTRGRLAAAGVVLMALFTVVARAAQDTPKGRLPDAATPTAYRLDLTLVPERERFDGHVEIDIQVKAATRSLFLHGRDLHVSAASVRSAGRTLPMQYTQ